MAYATYSDVQARLPGAPTFSTSTKPTQAQVTQWLVEADAFLNGALLAAGMSQPNADTQGLEILKSWATDYAEGHVRAGLAAAGGDGSNNDGQLLLAAFWDRIQNFAQYKAMLSGGSVGESSRLVRFPSLIDDDGNEIEPVFSRDEDVGDLGSQF